VARRLDAGAGSGQAVARLVGCETGEQVAQQVLFFGAEGLEQLGFGVVASSDHARLDPPAGRGYFGDAGAAVMRVEAADDQAVCFQPVQ
jgi:hypothetical protein